MSEILDLAKSFEQKLKRQAEDTDESVKAALKQHERVLMECLSAEQKKIESAIRDHSKKLNNSLLKSWIGAVIGIGTVILLGFGVLFWMQGEIRDRYTEMERLPSAKVRTCGEQKRLCVEIDQKASAYGTNGEFRIIKGG